MLEDQERLKELLDRYAQNELSRYEFDELCDRIKDAQNDAYLKDIIGQELSETEFVAMDKGQLDAMLKRVLSQESGVRRMFTWKRWAVAASIILAVGIGSYLLFSPRPPKEGGEKPMTKINDVPAPSVARATLKLDDGRIVYLDSVGNGQLAVQGNVNVLKTADGKLIYSQEPGVRSQELKYNTISNPRGSKVQSLTLIDGTQVWLNAESSITYPTAFIGSERNVTITGEADFVVKHNEQMTFKVIANSVEVRDIGTEFNVNAYNDEDAIRVTLLEGSVKVSRSNQSNGSVVIKPGQQVYTVGSGQLAVNKDVDVEQVMAWKNGLFLFDKTDIKGVMRQLARWYDVDVSFEGYVPTQMFGGGIQRAVPLSKVLENLEKYGVHFRIEDKKIVVLP
jgi:hypothetical protein